MKLLFVAFLITMFVVPLSDATPDTHGFSLESRQSDFAWFCQTFAQHYAYADRVEKPWTTWSTRYALAVNDATTPAAFAAVLEAALDELHDFHAEVRSYNPHRWLPVPTFADIWAEFEGPNAVVVAVKPGSDAERAGIAAGDLIQQIDGQPIESAISQRLTDAVDNHDTRARQWALLSLLTGRTDDARQITVQAVDGTTKPVTLPVQRRFDRDPAPLTWRVLPDNIGLIRFDNSLGDQKTVAALDAALLALKRTKGLVIDLRDVPSGGDSSVALGIMGRFVDRMLPYQRHRIPNYGQPDVERNWIELVAPRGPFTYKAPLVVLVDHWTGSMGEGLAIGFDAMHRATVVGTAMAHLAGAVTDVPLTKTGIDIAFATEQIYHVNGTPRQSWLPPVLVQSEGDEKDDAILKKGLEVLGRKTGQSDPKSSHSE